jgi:hypothetical protein
MDTTDLVGSVPLTAPPPGPADSQTNVRRLPGSLPLHDSPRLAITFLALRPLRAVAGPGP